MRPAGWPWLRYVLTATTLALLGVWAIGAWVRAWWQVSVRDGQTATYIRYEAGRIGYQRSSIWAQLDLETESRVELRGEASMRWWFEREVSQRPFSPTTVWVPLWAAAALPLGVSVRAWSGVIRRGCRRKRSLCPRCGYDLAGLPGPVPCPECGTARNGS
ncbi:MAG: hypothetical protein AB7G11_15030 [Phycisphaerales bacterium]